MSFDPETGEVKGGGDDSLRPVPEIAQLEARIAMLERDIQLLSQEHINDLRIIASQRTELSRRLTEDDYGKIAKAVARYYAERLKKSKGWKFGPKRMKVVLERLKEGYEGEFIARAIDGLAVGHYTNPETGVKYDDLELVCRDETKLERFHQIAEANGAPTLISDEYLLLLKGQKPEPPEEEATPKPAPNGPKPDSGNEKSPASSGELDQLCF